MKKNKLKNKDIKALIVLIVTFIIIAILVITGNTKQFDMVISNFIRQRVPEKLHDILEIITQIGGKRILPVVAISTCLGLLIANKEKDSLLLLTSSMLGLFAYNIIKIIIGRPRPYPFLYGVTEIGYSFPSGHATNNIIFYGILIYFVYKALKNKKAKIILTTVLSMWILTIGMTRIYFNVHYPSDVLAGYVLGLICIVLCKSLLVKLEINKVNEDKDGVENEKS